MMKRLFYWALCLLFFAACGKDSGEGKEGPEEKPGGEEITLEASSGDLVFEAGNANHTVSVTAAAYDGMEDRNVNLTVKAGDRVKTVGVTQKHKDAIVLGKDKHDVPQEGGTLTVELKTNVDYDVVIPDDAGWVSRVETRALRTDRLTFSVSGNEGSEDRSAEVVVKDRNGNLSDTLYIRQSGKAVVFTETVSGLSFEMVYVKGGTFLMGATKEQGADCDIDEKPVRRVTLSDYYIGKFEVTQGLWEKVMGENPSHFRRGDNYPVEQVSWNNIQDFLTKLNRLTGKRYTLPTEAQWEYAARGGAKNKGCQYSGGHTNTLAAVAWYYDNSLVDGEKMTHPVGTKRPNELGIYDMSGNVCEWCSDWFDYYSSAAATDPVGSAGTTYRVLRGGAWNSGARSCRVSYRGYNTPGYRGNGLGFRLVRLP